MRIKREGERKIAEYANERDKKRERVFRNNVVETRRMRRTVVGNYFQN